MRESEIITSRDNQHIKYAKRVREGLEPGMLFAEGVRLVEELDRSELSVFKTLVAAGNSGNERIAALIRSFTDREIDSLTVSDRIFDQIADTKSSQGIIAIAERPRDDESRIAARLLEMQAEIPVVVVLHTANDPSNVGSVIRTAEAAGAAGVILTKGSADAFSPKALRSSMGSSFRVPMVAGWTIEQVVEWGNKLGLIATAADVKAEKLHSSADWTRPRLLIFGSEAHGLNEARLGMMSEVIRIPLSNGVESLNLAVSSGIILFEAKRTASPG